MPDSKYCTHRSCKTDALAELLVVNEVKQQRKATIAEVRETAAKMFKVDVQVRCRHVPREGGAHAPLPPRKEEAA